MWLLEFDSTLGFPGEGPPSPFPLLLLLLLPGLEVFYAPHGILPLPAFLMLWIVVVITSFGLSWTWQGAGCWVRGWIFLALVLQCEAMPVFPRTSGEYAKSVFRAERPPVPEGRPVLPVTQKRRAKLLDDFLVRSLDEGLDMIDMLSRHSIFIDEINLILERYGRQMYHAGLSYSKYAETINAITSWKPAIRRSLQGAWDFGYAWNRHEPGTHHSAMPGPVALAMLTVSMLWGWTRFAGCFALMWAGLLRPGELLAAKRSDLLLPMDGDKTLPFGLLAINDPKTRYSVARHQSAKIDMADLLGLVEAFLGPLPPQANLWPMSGSTLRARFRDILKALSLPTSTHNGAKPLELASIRAGSATWILQTTEDGDLLQRRGRWANRKMMEIYVQEVTALIYLQRMPELTRTQVLKIADAFLEVKAKALQFSYASIPTSAWYRLFRT